MQKVDQPLSRTDPARIPRTFIDYEKHTLRPVEDALPLVENVSDDKTIERDARIAAALQRTFEVLEQTTTSVEEITPIYDQLIADRAGKVAMENTPIYDQMVYERLPDNQDALEILAISEKLEAHRQAQVAGFVESQRAANLLAVLKRIVTTGKFPRHVLPRQMSREEIEDELIEIEASLGGGQFVDDPEVIERQLFFRRNEKNPQQVDWFFYQRSNNKAKDVTYWYKVMPKEGIQKYYSFNHEQPEPTPKPVELIRNESLDEILWLKSVTQRFHDDVTKYFGPSSQAKHRAHK